MMRRETIVGRRRRGCNPVNQVDVVREDGRRIEPLWWSGVWSRETTSTLAGEYVTAREYMGKPGLLLEF